jgi:hypothetical protein
MDNEANRDKISLYLEEIARHKQTNGRPMLTALVVHKGDDNNPGEGFFAVAQKLGLYDVDRDPLMRLQFWVRQVSEVYNQW